MTFCLPEIIELPKHAWKLRFFPLPVFLREDPKCTDSFLHYQRKICTITIHVYSKNHTLHWRFYTVAPRLEKATETSWIWWRRLARIRRLVRSMQVATSLVTTNVLELRMEKWLSGWCTPVLEALTEPRSKRQNATILSPPLDLRQVLLQGPLLDNLLNALALQ